MNQDLLLKTAAALADLSKLAAQTYNSQDRRAHESVSAIIRNDKGELLVLDHVKHGQFTIPLGKVDKGMTPRESLIKELGEELGITPTKFRQVRIHKDLYMIEGKAVPIRNHVFLVDAFDGTPKNKEPEKHRKMKWMSRKEVRRITNKTKTTQVALKYLTK